MFRTLFVFVFFSIFLLVSCTPEDGFCIEETYSGSEDFYCSQLDEHFTATGSGIEGTYTSKKAIYDGSYVTGGLSGSNTVIIEKPDYIPETISMENMTSCTIAPSIGGVDCKKWYSFDFLTTDGDNITVSSRNGDDFSETLSLYYLTFITDGLEFEGYINNSKMGIYDSAVIEFQSVEITHKYTFKEK